MGYEIERKFLVNNDSWRNLCHRGEHYSQGYLSSDSKRVVRVRIQEQRGILTIKGPAIDNICSEFEYEIPVADAVTLLTELCIPPIIEKTRYAVTIDNLLWEIDEFTGDNSGLIIAEVELDNPDQEISLPAWVGREVTGETRFYNSNLGRYPYNRWSREERR